MRLRRLIALAGLALFATIAISPAGALAAAKGTDRPLKGTTTGSLTVSLPSGAATSSFTGNFSHLGATNGGDVADNHPHESGHVHLYGNGYSRGGERRRSVLYLYWIGGI